MKFAAKNTDTRKKSSDFLSKSLGSRAGEHLRGVFGIRIIGIFFRAGTTEHTASGSTRFFLLLFLFFNNSFSWSVSSCWSSGSREGRWIGKDGLDLLEVFPRVGVTSHTDSQQVLVGIHDAVWHRGRSWEVERHTKSSNF